MSKINSFSFLFRRRKNSFLKLKRMKSIFPTVERGKNVILSMREVPAHNSQVLISVKFKGKLVLACLENKIS